MRRVILLLTLLSISGLALGQQPGPLVKWERIGIDKVGRKKEVKTFSVDKKKNYKAIKLHVYDNNVIVEEWTLHCSDGTVLHAGFFGLAAMGREMPPVPVVAKLKKIRLKYYVVEGRKKARVEVLGQE